MRTPEEIEQDIELQHDIIADSNQELINIENKIEGLHWERDDWEDDIETAHIELNALQIELKDAQLEQDGRLRDSTDIDQLTII